MRRGWKALLCGLVFGASALVTSALAWDEAGWDSLSLMLRNLKYSIIPQTTNTLTLGDASHRYASIWSNKMDASLTTSTNGDKAGNFFLAPTATTGTSETALQGVLIGSPVITGTNASFAGLTCAARKTGADTSPDTINMYGFLADASNTGSTNAGTKNTYGAYFYAIGDTAGTSTAYGLYCYAQGADTNYAAWFGAGNVNVQALTASQAVFTDSNKNLVSNAISGTGSVAMTSGATLTDPLMAATTTNALINNAKGRLINDIYSIVTAGKIVELLVFDRTGAVTALKDYNYIGGATAHTETLSANASTLTPGVGGLCPYLTFTISSDLTTADANDLSFGDGATDSAFSIVILVNVTDMTEAGFVMKDTRTTGSSAREWSLSTTAGDKITFGLIDESASAARSRYYNTALTSDEGAWHCYAATYSGTALTGQKVFRDGVQIDDTSYSDGSYTAMENTTAVVGTYYIDTGAAKAGNFRGKYGVRLIVSEELTAAQLKRLDAVLRSYAGSDLN